MKKYEIYYRLSNGDECHYNFEGKDKAEAIRNYNHTTGCPKSAIINVDLEESDCKLMSDDKLFEYFDESSKLFEEITSNDLKWIKKLNRYVELINLLNKEK